MVPQSMVRKLPAVILPYFLFAIATCLAIFYFDEGRHSLEGLLKIGNFVTVVIYGAGFILGQVVIHLFTSRLIQGIPQFLVSVLLGIPLGFFLAIFMLMLLAFVGAWIFN